MGRRLDAVAILLLRQNPWPIQIVKDDSREIHRQQIDGLERAVLKIPDDLHDGNVATDGQRQVLHRLVERIEVSNDLATMVGRLVRGPAIDPVAHFSGAHDLP